MSLTLRQTSNTKAKLPGLQLHGPFDLSVQSIVDNVPAKARGVYTIGYRDSEKRFLVEALGSSHEDLRTALQRLIGSAQAFKFRRCPDERSTFELECELFHRFRPRNTIIHPERPAGSDWTCPHCLTLRR
jgi:hypothetical protein